MHPHAPPADLNKTAFTHTPDRHSNEQSNPRSMPQDKTELFKGVNTFASKSEQLGLALENPTFLTLHFALSLFSFVS